jgi:aryl-alcohol dehydrogenase-like predicted oxidoreductase
MTASAVEPKELSADDFRKTLPRFSEENMSNNRALVNEFDAFAKNKNISAAQLAIAWVLAQGEDIIPIPGTKKRKYLEENAAAVDVSLTSTDLQALDLLIRKYPHTGKRYSERSLQMVDR